MEYNFFADLLNKYSQLTPWIQAVLEVGLIAAVIAPFYFLKETICAIAGRGKGDGN